MLYSKLTVAATNILVVIPAFAVEPSEAIFLGDDSQVDGAAGAFASLPASFRILVPKRLVKLYRDRWAEYADHIEPYNAHVYDEDIIEVTLTEPNTLDRALGLQMEFHYDWTFGATMPRSLHGDYSHVRRLKVSGPISGGDLALIRHLAGYSP